MAIPRKSLPGATAPSAAATAPSTEATTEDNVLSVAKTPEVQAAQVPEWEHVAAAEGQQGVYASEKMAGEEEKAEDVMPMRRSLGGKRWTSLLAPVAAQLDRRMPRDRKYCRLSRNMFLLALGVAFALLILVIGLAAGLTAGRHHGGIKTSDLPLPSNTQSFTGDLTYYDPGLGACGEVDTSSDAIVAVSHILFDAAGSSSATGGNSNNNPLCNKMIRAQRYDTAAGQMRSVDLKVVDRCVGCKVDDLDTTEGVFAQMADVAQGRVDVTWAWLQPVATGS